jgi:hypothetical protein
MYVEEKKSVCLEKRIKSNIECCGKFSTLAVAFSGWCLFVLLFTLQTSRFQNEKIMKDKNIEKTIMKKQSNMEQMDSFRKEESIIPINNS